MAAGEEKRRQAVLARISRVRSRLNLEIYLRAAVAPMWVAATVFVLWRVFLQRGEPIVGGVLAVLALVATWWLSRKRGVSDEAAAVLADKGAGAGGLLLTRLERPVGEWELGLNQSLHALKLPEIDVRKPVSLLLLALCFVGAGLLLPKRKTVTPPPNAAAATRVEELAEKLDAVAKEEPLSDAAKQELERLKEELAENAFDAADWESADALESQLDKQAAEASRELERSQEAAKQMQEALAQAGEGESTQRQQDELERALMEMSDGSAENAEQAMQQALGENGEQQNGQQGQQGQQGQNGEQGQQQQGQNGEQNGQQQNGEQGQQQGQQGQNGQQQQNGQSGQQQGKSGSQQNRMNELQKALSQRQNQLSKPFGNSPQKQSASKSPSQKSGNQQGQGQGQQGEGQGEGQGQGQGQGQGKNGSEGHASRGMEQGEGVGRGGDSSELVFGGQAEMDPDRLAFEALPEGNGGESGELRGLRAANPRVKDGVGVTGSTGSNAAGEGAAGWGEGPMRPRNRALVEKYFNSK